MKITRLTALACAILVSGMATAENDAKDPTAAAVARHVAPDVVDWVRISDGRYDGISPSGETVRFYEGTDGAFHLRQDEQKRLFELRKAERSARSRGNDRTDESLDSLARNIAATKARIERLTAIALDAAPGSISKGLQRQSTFAPTCGWSTYGWTDFIAYPVMVDTPTASSTLLSFGSATFGPFPPWYPTNIYREVSAFVGADWSSGNYDWASGGELPTLEATASQLTFGGSCAMQTMQFVSATCPAAAGGGWAFYAIYRDQTCSGVLNNTPPIESVYD